jgi:hypothetical protein
MKNLHKENQEKIEKKQGKKKNLKRKVVRNEKS